MGSGAHFLSEESISGMGFLSVGAHGGGWSRCKR